MSQPARLAVAAKPQTAPAAERPRLVREPVRGSMLQRKCSACAAGGTGCGECSPRGEDSPLRREELRGASPRGPGHSFAELPVHADAHSAANGGGRGGSQPRILARPPAGVLQRQVPAKDEGGGIKNVTLNGFGTKPTPRASRHKTLTDFVHVTLDQPFAGTGEATVEDGGRCKQLRFGFIQLCRPFAVHRAIYEARESGERYQINNTDRVRALGPQLDLHAKGERWYASAEPDCDKGGKVKVGLDDTPATVFPIQPPSLSTPVFIRGLAWQEFFFTTFSVDEPGTGVRHLRSLYWTILYCETFDPPGKGQALGKSLAKTAKLKVRRPDPIPSEPGIDLIGQPAKETCNELVRSVTLLQHEGPGKHDSPCPIASEKD